MGSSTTNGTSGTEGHRPRRSPLRGYGTIGTRRIVNICISSLSPEDRVLFAVAPEGRRSIARGANPWYERRSRALVVAPKGRPSGPGTDEHPRRRSPLRGYRTVRERPARYIGRFQGLAPLAIDRRPSGAALLRSLHLCHFQGFAPLAIDRRPSGALRTATRSPWPAGRPLTAGRTRRRTRKVVRPRRLDAPYVYFLGRTAGGALPESMASTDD
jgi:hypothetical protein